MLGTAPKFRSAKKLSLSLCLRPPNNVAKGNFFCGGVRTGCKEKRAGRAKIFFLYLLIGLIAVAVTVAFVIAPGIYWCENTVTNPNTVLEKTRVIYSLDIYMYAIQLQDSVHYWMIYFVSRETDIWVERETKVRCCRKNIYFKESTRVEWTKANCALKITTISLDILLSF